MASTDDQAYLEKLLAKRQNIAGTRGVAFSDQRLDYDFDGLNAEIARVRLSLNKSPNVRLAAFSKGTQ